MAEADGLEACFSLRDREAILAALEAAAAQGLRLRAAGPRRDARQVADQPGAGVRQMALGPTVDFDEALRIEYRIVSRVCRGHDFYEGVRAVIVDKDNRPVWSPPPSDAEVDAYFAPLGPDELTFPTAR